jgi:OmpA-OmpF porin, OOP family
MKKIVLAGVIAAAFAAAPAFAQGYVGLGFGNSSVSGFDIATVSGGNTSKGSVKIFGGYQFTPNWGAELQYSTLGTRDIRSTTGATGSFTSSQFSIAATGTLPLNSSFSLIGKLGASGNRINTSGAIVTGSGNSTGLLVGIGAAYNFTPALSARLEYEDFGTMAKINNGSTVRANGYSLSLKYAF